MTDISVQVRSIDPSVRIREIVSMFRAEIERLQVPKDDQ